MSDVLICFDVYSHRTEAVCSVPKYLRYYGTIYTSTTTFIIFFLCHSWMHLIYFLLNYDSYQIFFSFFIAIDGPLLQTFNQSIFFIKHGLNLVDCSATKKHTERYSISQICSHQSLMLQPCYVCVCVHQSVFSKLTI